MHAPELVRRRLSRRQSLEHAPDPAQVRAGLDAETRSDVALNMDRAVLLIHLLAGRGEPHVGRRCYLHSSMLSVST